MQENLTHQIAAILRRRYCSPEYSQLKRLLYDETFPLNESFINLALVKEEEQKPKDQAMKTEANVFRDDLLQTFETIHQPKESIALLDIFTQQKEDTSPAQNLLIEGRAGVGKSTLCRYIANQWAEEQGKLASWRQRFTWVIWIPLRELTEENRLDFAQFTLAQYIYIKYLTRKERQQITVEKLAEELDKLIEQKQVLLLLDGYDEITDWLNSHKQHKEFFEEELLTCPYWVITSRPYYISKSTLQADRQLEVIGFVNENISHYVQQFFKGIAAKKQQSQTAKEKSLIQFLQSNPSVWGMSHIPINLELLCSVWEEEGEVSKQNLTLTQLYNQLVLYIFKRYLNKSPKATIKNLSWHDLENDENLHCRSMLAFLELLAWQGMQQNSLIISGKSIIELASTFYPTDHQQRERLGQAVLKELGLLKGVGIARDSVLAQDYYFVHLTFQEYWAARYIVSCWKKNVPPKGYQNIKDFIAMKKFDLRFEVIWWMVSGLVKDNDSLLEKYLYLLHKEPKDLLGLGNCSLLIRCLEESAEKKYFLASYGSLIQAIKQAFMGWFQWQISKYFLDQIITIENSRFFNRLRASPSIINNVLKETLCLLINNEETCASALNIIGQLKIDEPWIIDCLIKVLENNTSYSHRASAANALSSIGTKNVDASVKLYERLISEQNDYVKEYIIKAIASLNICNKNVVNELVNIIRSKSHLSSNAIRALAILKQDDKDIVDVLLDMLQGSGVSQYEAAEALSKLSIKDNRVKQSLLNEDTWLSSGFITYVGMKIITNLDNIGITESEIVKFLLNLIDRLIKTSPFDFQSLQTIDKMFANLKLNDDSAINIILNAIFNVNSSNEFRVKLSFILLHLNANNSTVVNATLKLLSEPNSAIKHNAAIFLIRNDIKTDEAIDIILKDLSEEKYRHKKLIYEEIIQKYRFNKRNVKISLIDEIMNYSLNEGSKKELENYLNLLRPEPETVLNRKKAIMALGDIKLCHSKIKTALLDIVLSEIDIDDVEIVESAIQVLGFISGNDYHIVASLLDVLKREISCYFYYENVIDVISKVIKNKKDILSLNIETIDDLIDSIKLEISGKLKISVMQTEVIVTTLAARMKTVCQEFIEKNIEENKFWFFTVIKQVLEKYRNRQIELKNNSVSLIKAVIGALGNSKYEQKKLEIAENLHEIIKHNVDYTIIVKAMQCFQKLNIKSADTIELLLSYLEGNYYATPAALHALEKLAKGNTKATAALYRYAAQKKERSGGRHKNFVYAERVVRQSLTSRDLLDVYLAKEIEDREFLIYLANTGIKENVSLYFSSDDKLCLDTGNERYIFIIQQKTIIENIIKVLVNFTNSLKSKILVKLNPEDIKILGIDEKQAVAEINPLATQFFQGEKTMEAKTPADKPVVEKVFVKREEIILDVDGITQAITDQISDASLQKILIDLLKEAKEKQELFNKSTLQNHTFCQLRDKFISRIKSIMQTVSKNEKYKEDYKDVALTQIFPDILFPFWRCRPYQRIETTKEAEQNQQKEQQLFWQQQQLQSQSAFLETLTKISVDRELLITAKPKIYFMYAWPLDEYQSREIGVQPFLQGLHDDLTAAGIEVIFDKEGNFSGNNLSEFMGQILDDYGYVMIFGTESFRHKWFGEKTALQFEGKLLHLKWLTDLGENKIVANEKTTIIPWVLTGIRETAIPENILPAKNTTVRALYTQSYIKILSSILSVAYSVNIKTIETYFSQITVTHVESKQRLTTANQTPLTPVSASESHEHKGIEPLPEQSPLKGAVEMLESNTNVNVRVQPMEKKLLLLDKALIAHKTPVELYRYLSNQGYTWRHLLNTHVFDLNLTAETRKASEAIVKELITKRDILDKDLYLAAVQRLLGDENKASDEQRYFYNRVPKNTGPKNDLTGYKLEYYVLDVLDKQQNDQRIFTVSVIAPGSRDLTSDIDTTVEVICHQKDSTLALNLPKEFGVISLHDMDSELVIQAGIVYHFNQLNCEKLGQTSAESRDSNVYIDGFMHALAFPKFDDFIWQDEHQKEKSAIHEIRKKTKQSFYQAQKHQRNVLELAASLLPLRAYYQKDDKAFTKQLKALFAVHPLGRSNQASFDTLLQEVIAKTEALYRYQQTQIDNLKTHGAIQQQYLTLCSKGIGKTLSNADVVQTRAEDFEAYVNNVLYAKHIVDVAKVRKQINVMAIVLSNEKNELMSLQAELQKFDKSIHNIKKKIEEVTDEDSKEAFELKLTKDQMGRTNCYKDKFFPQLKTYVTNLEAFANLQIQQQEALINAQLFALEAYTNYSAPYHIVKWLQSGDDSVRIDRRRVTLCSTLQQMGFQLLHAQHYQALGMEPGQILYRVAKYGQRVADVFFGDNKWFGDQEHAYHDSDKVLQRFKSEVLAKTFGEQLYDLLNLQIALVKNIKKNEGIPVHEKGHQAMLLCLKRYMKEYQNSPVDGLSQKILDTVLAEEKDGLDDWLKVKDTVLIDTMGKLIVEAYRAKTHSYPETLDKHLCWGTLFKAMGNNVQQVPASNDIHQQSAVKII